MNFQPTEVSILTLYTRSLTKIRNKNWSLNALHELLAYHYSNLTPHASLLGGIHNYLLFTFCSLCPQQCYSNKHFQQRLCFSPTLLGDTQNQEQWCWLGNLSAGTAIGPVLFRLVLEPSRAPSFTNRGLWLAPCSLGCQITTRFHFVNTSKYNIWMFSDMEETEKKNNRWVFCCLSPKPQGICCIGCSDQLQRVWSN